MTATVFSSFPMYLEDALFYYEEPSSKFADETGPLFTTQYWHHLTNIAHTARIIALGSDGNMWFSEHNSGIMGRITPDGDITEFPFVQFPS